MEIVPTNLPGVLIVKTTWHADERGTFSEVFSRRAWQALGLPGDFCQDNHAVSHRCGTVRGLHFQRPPSAQAKLVRVVRGAILDVAVDVRHNSPSFGHATAMTLSATNRLQMFIPAGFAHGYCTLEPDSEILYKVDSPYDPAQEAGLRWDDPALDLPWPMIADPATVNMRDRAWPLLKDLPPCFSYAP